MMVNIRRFRLREFSKPIDKERGDKGQVIRNNVREQLTETPADVIHAGTNYILNELFGLGNQSRNEYADEYGPKILKHGSRMAAQHFYQTGELTDLRFFFEAYRQLGSSGAIDLLKSRRDIGQLLSEYDVNNVKGFRMLTPSGVVATLELKTSVEEATNILEHRGLSPTYKGRTVMIFDYK